jgi:hypothetical protein
VNWNFGHRQEPEDDSQRPGLRRLPKSVSTLIEHLEPSPPDSAADYLRVVLETALATDSGAPVKLLQNEERTLTEALRQLRRRRPVPDDLTAILYRKSKRREGNLHRVR